MNATSSSADPGLKHYRADLHVHTALSPCASEDMTPPAIVATALLHEIEMIAVCDHNSAGNVQAVQAAAEAAGGTLVVLPGMELTSMEEVHVLGLFPDLEMAETVAARVRALLPAADEPYYAFFGEQPLLAADGRRTGRESAALAAATPLALDEVAGLVHALGGLAIAAHVDRKAFGVFSQLGVFPQDAGFDAVEVSYRGLSDPARMQQASTTGLPITSSSDSHFLDEIGAVTTDLLVAEPTFAELALALAGTGGRGVSHA